MSWIKFGLSTTEKERFSEFQKNRSPSMKVVGRGTLILSVEDARDIRKQKNAAVESSKDISYNLQPAR